MRNIAEFTLIGRVGTIKQVGKTVHVSICANYPFKDDKGQWKEDAHWNEVTIFTKSVQSYVSEHITMATWFTCLAGFGRTASSATANGSTRSI
jgi:single-strand DNA-binding protein